MYQEYIGHQNEIFVCYEECQIVSVESQWVDETTFEVIVRTNHPQYYDQRIEYYFSS